MSEEKIQGGGWKQYVNRANDQDKLRARQVEHFTAGDAYEAVAPNGEHLGYFGRDVFEAIYAPVEDAVESEASGQDRENESEDA